MVDDEVSASVDERGLLCGRAQACDGKLALRPLRGHEAQEQAISGKAAQNEGNRARAFRLSVRS